MIIWKSEKKAKIKPEPMLDMLYKVYTENQKQIEDCVMNNCME